MASPASSRIYIISPSVHVDTAWIPVKKFCLEVLRQDEKEEQFCFDAFDPGELDKIITTHKKKLLLPARTPRCASSLTS